MTRHLHKVPILYLTIYSLASAVIFATKATEHFDSLTHPKWIDLIHLQQVKSGTPYTWAKGLKLRIRTRRGDGLRVGSAPCSGKEYPSAKTVAVLAGAENLRTHTDRGKEIDKAKS